MAGVAEMMCKYGAGDKVLQLSSLDPFGFADFYRVTELFETPQELLKRAEELEREYDKIVIHDFAEFRFHFQKSKVILMFHGTKLREMSEEDRQPLSQYPCYVTTTDLLELVPSTLLPNPVDLEHFVNNKIEPGDNWFCINRSYQRGFIEKDIKSLYPKTEYYERKKDNIIQYEDMPHFLEQHENYVDMKYTYDKPDPKYIDARSCTGLQAMAVGCNVWDAFGKVTDRNLLLIHDARRVVQRFMKDFD